MVLWNQPEKLISLSNSQFFVGSKILALFADMSFVHMNPIQGNSLKSIENYLDLA